MAAAPFTAEELADFRAVAMAFPPHPTSDVARLLATLEAVETERDCEQKRADEVREALVVARAAQHQAEQKTEQTLKAAGAFLAALEEPDGDLAAACDYESGCTRLSTHQLVWEADSMEACDEHVKAVEKYSHAKHPLSVGYLSYAPALRTLRALLKEGA